VKYTIDCVPIAWARPRINGNRFFDSQKEQKLSYQLVIKNQHRNHPVYDNPLHLDAFFYFPIPKAQLKHNKENTLYVGRSDLDNLVKYILDCCNEVVFRDDALVVSMNARKLYSLKPRTEFTLTEI